MTTTEQRQIPPPSHFSASLNRSSAHGENFCQTLVLAIHLSMWSCVSKSIQCEYHSTSPTTHTHSHQIQHILSGASLTPPFDLFLPPNCMQLNSSSPPPKHADLKSLTVGSQTCAVTWLAVEVFVLKITRLCERWLSVLWDCKMRKQEVKRER